MKRRTKSVEDIADYVEKGNFLPPTLAHVLLNEIWSLRERLDPIKDCRPRGCGPCTCPDGLCGQR